MREGRVRGGGFGRWVGGRLGRSLDEGKYERGTNCDPSENANRPKTGATFLGVGCCEAVRGAVACAERRAREDGVQW